MAKTDWTDRELDERFDGASNAGRLAARTEPRAASVTYSTHAKTLRVTLTNGASMTIPVALVPALAAATPAAIRRVEILGAGGGLHWELLDLDLSVPALVASVFASSAWMTGLGLLGGKRVAATKGATARSNARKGGRPRAALRRPARTKPAR